MMSSPSTSWPTAEQQSELFQRLANQDPVAPHDLAEAFLEPLMVWLRTKNKAIPHDLCDEATEDAILSLARNPNSYNPDKLSLEAYLRMAAKRDLQNILAREKKHHENRISLESVDLSAGARNSLGTEEDPSLPMLIAEGREELLRQIQESVGAELSEEEQKFLHLMLEGERKTEAYAEALGIVNWPVDEQRKRVKRVKDKLKKRLQRHENIG